jgi:hypothetical protein
MIDQPWPVRGRGPEVIPHLVARLDAGEFAETIRINYPLDTRGRARLELLLKVQLVVSAVLAEELGLDLRTELLGRHAVGQERYGMALRPGNGRNALRDGLEEGLDQCAYLQQALLELEGRR